MKAYVRWPLLAVTLTAFFLLVLFCFVNLQNTAQHPKEKKQTLGIEVQKEIPGLPVRLIIPSININASIQQVGVIPNGEMEVPSNATDVGWFKLGSRPGEKGSAAISGHFDGKNGEAGVFANLYKLKKGDKLRIVDAKGKSIYFVVRESRIYYPGYADVVFSRNDGTYLNLITCDGVWDGIKKSYSKRLVIFADIAQ